MTILGGLANRRFSRPRGAFVVVAALAAAAVVAVTIGAMAMADDGSVPVPAGEAERLGGGAQQQAALADGSVTQAEYSEAFQRTLDCLRDAGIPFVVSNNSRGEPQYSAGPFASKGELDRAKPVVNGCYVEHLRGLDVAQAAAGRP
ncbi:MAG: hypothetical protein HY875_14585 [Chloroflexi bacterium]|nr:hypothetical protein [Chloroflexota bacterium]